MVYYCDDDFGALTGVDHAAALEMETRLVARADLILAASRRWRSDSRRNGRCMFLMALILIASQACTPRD